MINFILRVSHLPQNADTWTCSFKDAIGVIHQRSDLIRGQIRHPDKAGVSPFSVPVPSSGTLSIIALGKSSPSGISINIVAAHNADISVKDGGEYTFDFESQKVIGGK